MIPVPIYPNALLLDKLIEINNGRGRGEITAIDFVDKMVTCKLQVGTEHVEYTEKSGFVRFRGARRRYL